MTIPPQRNKNTNYYNSDSDDDIFRLDEANERTPRRRQVVLKGSSSETGSYSSDSDSDSRTDSTRSETPSGREEQHGHKQRHRRRPGRDSRTRRGRLNAAILEETEDCYLLEPESYTRRYFRTSSTSPPATGRTKDPIAPGIYTRVRKRSATPMDFEDVETETEASSVAKSPLVALVEEAPTESIPLSRRDTMSSRKPGDFLKRKKAASIVTTETQSPTGLPIIQEFILDSQFSIIVEGRSHCTHRAVLYYLLCVLSLGIVPLISIWFPALKAKLTTQQTSLATSTHVFVTNSFHQQELLPVRRTYYGNLLSDVFGKQIVHELIIQDEPEEDTDITENEMTDVSQIIRSVQEIEIEANEDIEAVRDNEQIDNLSEDVEPSDSDSELEEIYYTVSTEAFPLPIDHVEVKDTDSYSSFFTVHDAEQPSPSDYLYFFEYRSIRFLYHPNTGRYFENGQWDAFHDVSFQTLKHGLTESLANQRRVIFDENIIDINERSTWSLMLDELVQPFNVFQVLCILLWCFESYFIYAITIFLMTTGSSAMTIYETRHNRKVVSEWTSRIGVVSVFRDGFWHEDIPVSHLVPGDIFEVKMQSKSALEDKEFTIEEEEEETEIPCDAMLLDGGDCIVNESMLTGESQPISKIAMDDEEWDRLVFSEEDSSLPLLTQLTRHFEKSILYAGTKLVRVRKDLKDSEELIKMSNNSADSVNVTRENNSNTTQTPNPFRPVSFTINNRLDYPSRHTRVRAVVLRTGFNTTKGNLIRTMLFPRPTHFRFYRDSLHFVAVMGALSIIFFFYTLALLIHLGQSFFFVITKACDMFTIMVPPALPASMNVGADFALLRLKKKKIYCICPSRINVAGKADCLCFDKTGTLTEDSLDLLGIHCINKLEEKAERSSQNSDRANIEPSNINLNDLKMNSDYLENIPDSMNNSSDTSGIFPFPSLLVGPLFSCISDFLNRRGNYCSANDLLSISSSSWGNKNLPKIMCLGMATCHTLRRVKGDWIGDPLEKKMISFIQTTYVSFLDSSDLTLQGNLFFSTDRNPYNEDSVSSITSGDAKNMDPCNDPASLQFMVLRCFEFIPELRRQSVIVKATIKRNSQSNNIPLELKSNHNLKSELHSEYQQHSYSFPVANSPGSLPDINATSCHSYNGNTEAPDNTCIFAFVKGSPEEIKELCLDLPKNFDDLLDHYTFRGYRVLAMAFKLLQHNEDKSKDILNSNRRDQIESELNFLGFLVFENRLKPATIPCLALLSQEAKLRTLMCTGDNILTAISVAKDCGMIHKEAVVFIPFLSETKCDPEEAECSLDKDCKREFPESKERQSVKAKSCGSSSEPDGERYIRWVSSLDSRHILSPYTLAPVYNTKKEILPNANPDEISISETLGTMFVGEKVRLEESDSLHLRKHSETDSFPQGQRYALACTGRILDYLIDYCHPNVLQRVLLQCAVYARLSPNQKQRLVECLQRLDYTVAFCGDGANDCGALKAAHIGISLSEAEASVVAPFTSSRPDISCVLDLISEGRSSLVTSFSVFKYMILYSFIQFNTVFLLYHYGSNLGDFQFAFIDILIIIPLAISMNRLHPAGTRLHAVSPTSNLLSQKVLGSLFGQLVLALLFQDVLYSWLKVQSWYEPVPFTGTSDNISGQLNSALFCLSAYQYIVVAFVFSNNSPHQRSILTNRPFIIISIALLLATTLVLLAPSPWMMWLLELVPLPFTFRCTILGMAVVYAFLAFLVDSLSSSFVRCCIRLFPSTLLQREAQSEKLYRKLLNEMKPDTTRV